MAILPTPPVAPVTIIGPCAGSWPFCSILITAKAAVKPAVPIDIASSALISGGRFTTACFGTLATSEYPPSKSSESPAPQTRTSSPSPN